MARHGRSQKYARYAISLDVGGTFTKVAVVNTAGEIVQRLRVPSAHDIARADIPDHVVQIVKDMLRVSSLSPKEIAGVCVGIPGVIDTRTDHIVSCPNLTNWEDMPLARQVQDKLGLPTYLEKDANEAALGEHWMGAGRGVDDLICFTIGTGIGTGLILDGKLYRGSAGGAGEIGHIIVDKDGPVCTCGKWGCLEAFSSARAIVQRTREFIQYGTPSAVLDMVSGDLNKINAEVVFRAAKAGDELAIRIVSSALEYLGVGITNVVNALNPAMIILGGGVALAGAQLLVPVQNVVRQRARRLLAEHVQIVLAKLGGDAGVIGGAYLVFREQEIEVNT